MEPIVHVSGTPLPISASWSRKSYSDLKKNFGRSLQEFTQEIIQNQGVFIHITFPHRQDHPVAVAGAESVFAGDGRLVIVPFFFFAPEYREVSSGMFYRLLAGINDCAQKCRCVRKSNSPAVVRAHSRYDKVKSIHVACHSNGRHASNYTRELMSARPRIRSAIDTPDLLWYQFTPTQFRQLTSIMCEEV